MKKILAMGSLEFVRLLQMGGADARLVDTESLASALEAELTSQENGTILLDPALADAVPAELASRLTAPDGPQVLILEQRSAGVLRDRIRRVVGADLMASNMEESP